VGRQHAFVVGKPHHWICSVAIFVTRQKIIEKYPYEAKYSFVVNDMGAIDKEMNTFGSH
jgi:hypothetical protein